jgi:hypothetical protein
MHQKIFFSLQKVHGIPLDFSRQYLYFVVACQAWRIKMNLREILADIHALEDELLKFERKYGLRSETFYAAYMSGEEPEDEKWVLDFGEWASVYRTWLARQAEYRNEVQRMQRRAPSIEGLIQVAA